MIASLIKIREGTAPARSVPSDIDPVLPGTASAGELNHADLDEEGDDQSARRSFRPFTALFTASAAVLGGILLLVDMVRGPR